VKNAQQSRFGNNEIATVLPKDEETHDLSRKTGYLAESVLTPFLELLPA
jgi:hypothetical protein